MRRRPPMSFRDLPIKRKLTLISLLTSGVALILACAAFVAYEQITFRKFMVRDLTTLAEMIGYNSASALSFNDAGSAEQTLKGLTSQPHVVAACIYDADGTVFATYQRPGPAPGPWPIPQITDARFGRDRLELFSTIELGDDRVGTLYIRSDLERMHEQTRRYVMIAAAVMLVAAAAALLINARVQRVISDPVSELASIARVVAGEKNYAVRAVKQSNDELGHLIDGFNDMLAQIQIRDAELQQARAELEKRVEERTAALQLAQQEAAGKAAQLRFIFEAVPIGVSWFDHETGETMVNGGFFHISGLRREDFKSHETVRAITHPNDLKQQDRMRERLERGEIDRLQMEKRYLRPEGAIAWVVLTIKVFRDVDGRIAQEVFTVVDITERKQAEAERERIQRQLLDVSRQAGMAEVATGVLHNVGNVLNSVNVAATVAIDQVRASKAANLTKLSALFEEHAADPGAFLTHDPRGRRVPGYIKTLAEDLAAERATIATELEHLRRHIEHIKEIVSMQQSYAKISGVAETVPLTDVVEDALRMNAGALTRHGLEVVREFNAHPVVTIERHKVLQILVNLIRNAKYACDESGRADKQLKVSIANGGDGIRISVADNGVGIPAANLTRIFAHGFTTRSDGHGFGLHSGALAAKELGGSLLVHSDGPGRGAVFTLVLPLAAAASSI